MGLYYVGLFVRVCAFMLCWWLFVPLFTSKRGLALIKYECCAVGFVARVRIVCEGSRVIVTPSGLLTMKS